MDVSTCHGPAILCEFTAIPGGQEGQSRQDADIKLLSFSADVGSVSEKRSEPRVNMMALIEAQWQDEAGNSQTARGKLEDLSDGGLCIRINEPIGIGSKLIVRTHRENFTGTVVQSRQYGRDFVLGIKRDAAQKPDGK
jgi:PilZ domain